MDENRKINHNVKSRLHLICSSVFVVSVNEYACKTDTLSSEILFAAYQLLKLLSK